MVTHTSAQTQRRPRLPRYRRAAKPVPHQLTQRDQELLAALQQYPFLTAEHCCRFVFGSLGSLSYCRDRLKRLYHAHLVDRLFLPRSPHGSPLTVYTLKHRNPTHRSLYFLDHTLAVTDFILTTRACCQDGHLELKKLVLEHQLRRQPVRVREGDRQVAVIPDCYLQLVLNGRYELAWCLELDRASESSRAFRRKVARYLTFAAGPYQEGFGTTALTIVIVTTGGPRRLLGLTQAVEQELVRLDQVHQADLFRLASVQFTSESTDVLFRTPRFQIPFQENLVALVPEEVR